MVAYGVTLDQSVQETLTDKDLLIRKYRAFFRLARLAASARTA